jgi:hypothetical protein
MLQRHHQRATYGAVAAVLGRTPRNVMQGRPRNWLHSWVVNQETGRPSEYPDGMIHPALEERLEIISSEEDLTTWLKQNSDAGKPA